jgi:leucyl/phenylalanyl-tRNA--protein transferase
MARDGYDSSLMPVFRLDERLVFPRPELAEDGLLAIGGDLSTERVLLAYSSGIFPWYSEGEPILWHSPDPRMVLLPGRMHVGRSLRKVMARKPYLLTLDVAFDEVMRGCSSAPRAGQDGTWITKEMVEAYVSLHRLGYAHSVEAWEGRTLVGGLYGVCLGGIFFGESMFARAPDASKIAFVSLVRQLISWDIGLVDCQVYTEHLERFGAFEIPRSTYLRMVRAGLRKPTQRGSWTFDEELVRVAPAPGLR